MEGEKKIEKYAFSLKNMLGKGSYASVYKGRVIATDEPVAVKVMNKSLFKNAFNLKNICSEIEIMKKLNHRNIVRMLDVFQTSNNMYLITEYCDQGDLMHFMRKRKRVPEKEALKIFQDILEGYRYLHTNKITHRDIKPANILIHGGVCKLVDFGFAKKADTMTVMSSLVGTPLYMSPQILKRETYTSKADLWSVGLILYELMHGTTPWMAYNEVQLL
jgi:serine/threonine protein kinase